MPSSSRIIFAEQLGEVEPFAIGRLQPGGGAPSARAPRPSIRAEDPHAAQLKGAFEEGFRRGAADAGRRLAQKRAAEESALGGTLAARLDALTEGFAREIDALEHGTADRVVALAIELARRLAGDTLSTRPEAIAAIVRDALAALVETSAAPVLHLNPSDLVPVEAQLGPTLARRRIEVQADPAITPGGCLLVSAGGAVDATLETRWERALAAIGREPTPPPAVAPRPAREWTGAGMSDAGSADGTPDEAGRPVPSDDGAWPMPGTPQPVARS